MAEKILGKCKICEGNIVEKYTIIYPENIVDAIFKSTQLSKSIYCKKCGVKYEFYPPDQKEGKNNEEKTEESKPFPDFSSRCQTY